MASREDILREVRAILEGRGKGDSLSSLESLERWLKGAIPAVGSYSKKIVLPPGLKPEAIQLLQTTISSLRDIESNLAQLRLAVPRVIEALKKG